MKQLCIDFDIDEKYYVEDFIKELPPLKPDEVNKIYQTALKLMQK